MKADLGVIEPWDFLRQSLPGDGSQNGIVGPSGIRDEDLSSLDGYLTLSLDEIPVELWGIASFKPSEILSQPAVESVGDHCHDDVEVDFDQDRRGECIKVKEFHRFGNAVLDAPAAGIVSNNEFHFQELIFSSSAMSLCPRRRRVMNFTPC